MSAPLSPSAWAFADEWVSENEALRQARDRSAELGLDALGAAAASTLMLLTSAISAQAVIEVGTGAGISGAAILSGMTKGGVLTTIDVEAEHQRAAKETFTEAGFSPARSRMIVGRALDVLPRMSDAAYDMVVVDGDRAEYPAIVAQAKRLLRIGGLVVLIGMLDEQGIADPAHRDVETLALRDAASELEHDDDWLPAMITAGPGMLVAQLVERPEE